MKHGKCGRRLALMLSMALLAGVAGGCGKAEKEAGGLSGPGSGGSSEQTQGRYVEEEERLPGELADWGIVQIFAAEDRLHLLAAKQEDGKSILREWEKREDGYEDVTQGWLSSLDLPGSDWLDVQFVRDGGGGQYLYAEYLEGDDYRGHLWKGAGNTAEEITPEVWTVPDEDWGGYEKIQNLAALDNGTLAALSYTSLYLLSGEDGSVMGSASLSYYNGMVTDGENLYLSADSQIEKRRGIEESDAMTIPFPAEDSGWTINGTEGDVKTFGGGGMMSLAALKDGTLVAAGEDGIFRLAGGNGEAGWEKLADGVETDFAMKEYACVNLAALEDGSIYALFWYDNGLKLNRYEYDPNAVSQVTQILNIYSVYENSLLKQAAVLYHKAHPEVLVNIQYEYSLYDYGTPDYDAVYKKLNTMLVGDDAPDIVVMDRLHADSYVSKGVLADLDGLVRPMEESGELLANITGAYIREDGKRYVVPLQFGFNMVLGRDIAAENMESMEALAGFLAKADYSYMGKQTVEELVDIFYPYFCDAIVREKQLDKEALGRYLEYLKVIGDNCGIVDSHPQNEINYGMWDLAAKVKLAFNETGGFLGCMIPVSMAEYIKGDFAAFENRFIPYLELGICEKSRYQDTAKDFLLFALSEEVQELGDQDGFPVNRLSMKNLAEKDRSAYMASMMIGADDGEYIQFDSKPYSQETANRLKAMCEALDRPIKEDAKIRQVLIECLGGYLDGTWPKEQTIQKIEDGLKMYLAE